MKKIHPKSDEWEGGINPLSETTLTFVQKKLLMNRTIFN